MNKRVRRLLLQVFSSLNALFLTFQPLAALPVLLTNPVVVQAEAGVSADAVNLTFDTGSHEFRLRVKTDQAMPYVLTYLDEKQDPQVEQAAQGNLEKMEDGVFGADVYAGTCSGGVCTPITFLRGTLVIGESFKNSFQFINGAIVFDGQNPAVEQVCVNLEEVGMTAGEMLWSVDEATGVAETKNKVQPGVSYQFPLDDTVSVTFSCLPKDESLRSPLKIQQVLVSELNLPDSVKTDATYAYDITTEMENGTFKYELTLPKSEGVEAEVVYIEKSLEEVKTSVLLDEVITIEETEDVVVEQELDSDEIKLSGLEHFSIYLTTYTNYTVGSSGVTNPENAWTSNDQYAVFDTDGDWAEYRFDNLPILSAGDTIDGIKIIFEGNTTVTTAYFDVAVYNKSSNSYSTSKASSLFGITPPDSSAMFAGGSNDKWGKSWASSDFSSNNFKIKITKKSSGTINLDRVWVEIYYTPAPICTNDQQGANDEPGQKDLTQMCHQSSNLPQKLEVEWNWDESGWSGNNTGDACSLYDTNSNGNANYAICVTVGGNPASLSNQRLFSCDDGSNNKCSGPTNITPGAFGPCLASVENSDPFPSGDAYPNDTHAWCNIWLSQYGLPATLQLIDVCSYPSQQPNSDPSDCILASTGNSPTATPTPTTTTTPTPMATPSPTPTSSPTPTNTPSPTPTNTPTPTATPTPNPGTITIIKDTQPDSSQDFVFSFSGVGQTATEFSLDDDSDPTLSNTYEITDLPTNIYDISEQGVSGWTNTSVICQSNMPWDPQDSPDGVGYQGSVSISLVAGENVTCTFTNLRDTGSITVNKLIDTDGDRVFESGNTRANELGFTWSVNNGAPNSMGSTALNIPTTLGEDKYYVEESSVTGYRTVGWYLSDGSCDNLDGTTVPAEVTVAKDGVTAITFCNAVDAFCGDGMVNQDNEQCDYGQLNGQSSCSAQCTWVSECRQEMVANGGFETPVVSQGAGWDAFDNTQMAGWTAEWYGGSATYNGHDRPEPKTELHRGVSGWSPASGSQYVELDTDWTGPVNGFNGEPASIALSQDIPTIPGYQYTLNWKHSPRPNHNNNHLQVVVGDTEVFNSGNLAGGSNTNWQTQSYSFVATTDLTTISFIEIGITDSFGMFLDDVEVECNGLAPVEVFAHKVVCQSEADLPNWGDDAGGQVTATTAQDYVNQSDGRCRLAEDWDFEWGYDGSAPKQSGEYVGYAGAPWTEFNVKTFEASPAAAIIPNPDNKTLWFREVLQEGYIPFTYPPDASPGSNVSAEFYCNNDHYKYDNYESISNAKPGDTYYCVAFNAPTAKDVEICKVDNQDKAQSGWTVGLAKQTPEFNEVIPVTSGAGVDAALPAGEHVVFASGTYRYGSSAMIADAGFSYRPLSIPMGADGWVSGDQLTTVGGLELKVGGQNIAWGGYNPTHQYTTLVSGFAGGNLNFNIWDNQYSDNLNNGNFRAQVHQVITTGVTEDDGCVTLEDVPYGDYVAFELPQDNWSHVSTMVNGQNTDTFPAPITVGGRDSSVTFENRLVTGQLRVQKTTDPAGDPTVFNLTATGGGLVFGSATGSVTDATDYTYTVEPQTYSVSEDIPNGWELTSNNCSNLLVPSDGQRVCQISNTKLYDIHGYKWNDVNRNAIDDQEARLPGWEIFIDQNDNQQWDDGEPKTTTSSDPDHLGWYWFENLYAGTYDVCEILQDGWAQTYPVDPMCHSVTLPDLNPRGMAVSENAVVGPEYNFGNTQYGDASVYKYEDLNTNGKYDAGEPLLPDWEMVLGSSDNGELRQTTDTSGNTVFDVLGGTYYLSEEMQEGWYQSAISCDSNLGGVMITQPNYAYGHHGMCSGWNTCGDAATCALKACEANGYSTLVSYGDQRPCTEFDNCSLFYNINEDLSYQADWGNWCGVMGVTDIVCSNSSRLIRPVVNKPVVVNPGETSTCYVGNYKPGIIEGTKYFDADQDGRFDDGESVMQYWGISLTGPDIDQQVVTDENGAFSFTNLKKGTYTLCEEDRTAWGWQVTEPAEPIDTVCREVVIDRSGETEIANFGNFIDSRLYILKTNDAWPTDVTIGDEVTYTIRVMAVGGPVYDATVLDVPPAQLSYVPDSYTAESSNGTDLRADGTTGDPNYQSPGKWTLGDLDKDEIVTLTYKAKVGTLADPGVYPDMVWATGTSEQSRATEGETDDLLALSDPDFSSNSGGVDFDGSQGHFGEDNFAGTQVAVVLDQTPFSEYQVGKTEEKQGDVLGASTELPATGARTWLTLLALISIVAGAGFLIMGKRSRNSGLKTLVGLFVVGFSLWFAQPAQALTSVRVEEPYNNSAEFTLDAITNQTTMKIDFVVLNTDNISVTAQCQQQRNDGAWSNITTNYTVKAGGNSGYCEAKDLEHDQNYDFRVVVSGDGPDKISDEVRVGLDTNRPDKPVNYSKNPGNYCEDKIGFKTANDGQTSSVEVYRSTDNDHFTAKPDTRVITIPIGPNQEYTLTTSKPNCDDTYYYVIRAFDVNGNASDLVGDLEIKTVIIESASGTTQTVQLGAIPAGSAFIAGGSTTDETAEGTTGEGEEEAGEPETTAEPTETESTEGTVLGSATETFMSFLTRFGLPIGVGLIVLAGLYVIFFGKRNEK